VEAFSKMPNKKLIVGGDGPDFKKISKLKSKNIQLLGYIDNKTLLNYSQSAKAFIFAAEEDFGIAPIEAQACGVPVIAYGKGGALETIVGSFASDNKIKPSDTGVFFEEQTVESLVNAVNVFEKNSDKFDKVTIRNHALKFDTNRFEIEFKQTVEKIIANHKF
jgi:glycosyltransferase involved in cell wall biosynthesis